MTDDWLTACRQQEVLIVMRNSRLMGDIELGQWSYLQAKV